MSWMKHILNPQNTVPLTTRLDKKAYTLILFINGPYDLVAGQEVFEFSLHKDDFAKAGCDMIAISGGSHTTLQDWFKEIQSKSHSDLSDGIGLISDMKHVYARDFGILKVGQNAGSDPHALFIIDSDQKVCYHNVLSTEIPYSTDECLRLINAFKATESNQVLAPADWKDQGDSVSNDSDAIKKFFNEGKSGEAYTGEKKEKALGESAIIDSIKSIFSDRKSKNVYKGERNVELQKEGAVYKGENEFTGLIEEELSREFPHGSWDEISEKEEEEIYYGTT